MEAIIVGYTALLGFVIFMVTGFTVGNRRADKQAEAIYLNKVLELKSPVPPYRFQLKVKGVSGTGFFGWNFMPKLWGTLLVEQPQGAQYLGATPGSLTVNWRGADGKGFTWFLRGFWILQMPEYPQPEILITDLEVE